MLQIQNTWFHVNWLGQGSEYPRFGRVKEDFLDHFRKFERFLKSRELPSVELNQWDEVVQELGTSSGVASGGPRLGMVVGIQHLAQQ